MALTFRNINTLYADLYRALRNAGSALNTFRPGSGLYTLSRGWLALLARNELELRDATLSFYAQLASGDDLDRRVNDFGLFRNEGTVASGLVTITTSDDTVALLPRNTILQNSVGSLFYITEEEVVIGNRETFTVRVSSLNAGTQFNQPIGARLVIPALPENSVVVVQEQISGGSDRETDEQLRARFQDFILSLQESTLRAVRRAVLAIPQVRIVRVLDQVPVYGSFTVVYDSDNSVENNTDILGTVTQAVENIKALGVPFEVIPVTELEVDVSLRLTYKSDIFVEQVDADVSSAVTDFFNALAIGEEFRVSNLVNAVIRSNDAIYDVLVLNPATNTAPQTFERLVLRSIQIQRVIL